MTFVRDSIHGNIELADWAFSLIDAPELQRLRRIRQLGTAGLVYPGANHTRFEHSLGALRLAQEAARHLRLEPDDARVVEAAALLHDVGHGPMSHLFDPIFEERGQRHEDHSLRAVQEGEPGRLLERHGIPVRAVAEAIQGRGPHGRVVSGDIDVDRMDYLVRDAHYTGVPSGADPDRLLSAMEIRDGFFVVRQEGLTAAEGLLVTRFLMYPSVYFHHACRAAETMLVEAIRATIEAGTPFDRIRSADDAELMTLLRQGPKFALGLAERIDERRLYKRALEGTDALVARTPILSQAVGNRRGAEALRAEIAQSARVGEEDVLIDAPHPPKPREVEARLLRRDGTVEPLAEASAIVRSLLAAARDHWRLWVFAAPEKAERVAKAAEKIAELPTKVKRKPLMERPR